MSLRAKLVASSTVLLLVVIGAVGAIASRSVRDILVSQIDADLTGFASRGPARDLPGNFGDRRALARLLLLPFAEVLVDRDGSILLASPSGFSDQPDPLPDVSDLPAGEGLTDLDSVDGSLEYRAFVHRRPNGTVFVQAAPLTDVAAATSSLVRTLLVAGGGVLLFGGAATWWTVTRAVRPVDEMVDTAAAIAGGDLGRRVPDLSSTTELGRLSDALNKMLVTIEGAVTAERDARERLHQFLADASHELRTPLTTITGYAELRRRGGLRDQEAEDKAWARIESESQRMTNLTRDLLALTRLGRGQPLDLGEVDLVVVARDAADDHRAMDPERRVTVRGPTEAVVRGDAERLHQVVANLLSNARVHTPPGTEVVIEVTSTPDMVEVAVADTGPGIPPEALDHVFERLYRADSSRSRRSGGAGLGLAIVKAIVSAHGGVVSAETLPEGGARVSVTLPRRPPPSPAEDAALDGTARS